MSPFLLPASVEPRVDLAALWILESFLCGSIQRAMCLIFLTAIFGGVRRSLPRVRVWGMRRAGFFGKPHLGQNHTKMPHTGKSHPRGTFPAHIKVAQKLESSNQVTVDNPSNWH